MTGKGWRRVHLVLAIAWAVTIVPTIVWWHDSVLWVGLMSVYAIVATHWTGYQAGRAEVAAECAAEDD